VAIGALRDGRHLFHLFVDPAHQRSGLARHLWTQLRDAAVAAGNTGGFTVNSTLDARPVYERFGFVAAGDPQRVHGIAFQPMTLTLATAPPAVDSR
jgi:GNAT superfamily N-acetyltransferase